MQEIDIRIQELNKTICENIELIDFTSRGLVSQNILSQARNLVEHVAMKAYGTEHDLTVGYGDIKTSLSFIKTDNKYLFFKKIPCVFTGITITLWFKPRGGGKTYTKIL